MHYLQPDHYPSHYTDNCPSQYTDNYSKLSLDHYTDNSPRHSAGNGPSHSAGTIFGHWPTYTHGPRLLLFSALFICATLFLINPNQTQAQAFTATDGYVEFTSRAPLLEFQGKSSQLAGLIDFEKNLLDFYVDLTTIDTGIRLRNKHMNDSYLETDKFPFAEFTGTLSGLPDLTLSAPQPAVAEGTFTIHGVSREIRVEGTLQSVPEGLQLNAAWTVLLDDYNIRRPKVVFYELAEEQEVEISILLRKTD